jgi:CBS-domain-containing membrane protein
MLNQQIISPEIKPLHLAQTVEQALEEMDSHLLLHLPVVVEGQYKGLLSSDDLLDADAQQLIGDMQVPTVLASVAAHEHFFSAVRTMANQNLSALPVVAANQEYVGTITRQQLFLHVANALGLQSSGALIVLQLEPRQFSISELSKLVETNDATITQLNTSIDEASGLLTITIRLNKEEVSGIIATLQRYDYHVEYYSGEEHYENELRHNYNHLMNFLTI